MSWTCDCGTTITGLKLEHCTAERGCHQTFTTTKAGDVHRVGPHEGPRRCLTPAEMKALPKPLEQNDRGHWRFHSDSAPRHWAKTNDESRSVLDSDGLTGVPDPSLPIRPSETLPWPR